MSRLTKADIAAFDKFTEAMRKKLIASDRRGWLHIPPHIHRDALYCCIGKGDPVDVANYCLFLWNLGETTSALKAAMQKGAA